MHIWWHFSNSNSNNHNSKNQKFYRIWTSRYKVACAYSPMSCVAMHNKCITHFKCSGVKWQCSTFYVICALIAKRVWRNFNYDHELNKYNLRGSPGQLLSDTLKQIVWKNICTHAHKHTKRHTERHINTASFRPLVWLTVELDDWSPPFFLYSNFFSFFFSNFSWQNLFAFGQSNHQELESKETLSFTLIHFFCRIKNQQRKNINKTKLRECCWYCQYKCSNAW